MTARRMLFATAAGPFPSAVESTFEITAPPQGAWPWGNAHHYGAHSYVGFANNAGGIRVAIVADGDPASTVVSTLEADAFTTPDQHNSPALWKRSDGRLLAVYMPHAGPNAYRRITVNSIDSDPTISGGWQARTNIDSQLGATLYTYPDLHTLAAGPLVFHRDQDGQDNWEINRSTDDGGTWGGFVNVRYGTRVYARSFVTADEILHVVVTNGSYAEDQASIFHFKVNLATMACYKTDGTLIAGGAPVAFSDMTKIWDGPSHSAGVRAPADMVVIGDDIAVVFTVQTGTPHDHIGEDEDYLYARSNAGGAWATSTVATNVGALTFEFTEGSLAIDRANLSRLAVSRRAVSDLAYPFRVYDVTSPDGGATWPAGTVISVDDGNSATYPTFVRDYGPGLRLVWLQGPNHTSQNDFSTGIQGRGVAA